MEVDEQPLARDAAKGKAPADTPDDNTRPWIEKYRPTCLADVAAHKDIIDTIGRLTQENRLPHLLLYGPPGTGKTSTINAVARQLYGTSYGNMTLELNASDDRGIDVVRQQIQDFASTKRIFSVGFKLVILDECDAMTKDAQFALRRIIEKYTRNTRFCLICNYVNKIIHALQSRCTRFRFAPLAAEAALGRVQHVIQCERLDATEDGVEAVLKLGGGDMRRTLNILQSTAMSAKGTIDAEAVYACTGQPRPQDIEQVAHWLLNEDFATAHANVAALQLDRGIALVDIVRELDAFVFRIHMPAAVRAGVIEALADIEYRLASVTHEQLQLGALVAAFTTARDALVKAAV